MVSGAEPMSTSEGEHGVLVIHGFTGNPVSMRGIADAAAAAGFSVEMPLLPGHGTSVDDMLPTRWDDWANAAEAAYASLRDRVTGKVVVVGLSMGGALTCHLATQHPEIAGIVAINALVSEPAGIRDLLAGMVEAGETTMDAIGSDIADPDADEKAYGRTPLAPLVSLLEAAADLTPRLTDITCPTLIITSHQDHTVEPANSELLAAAVRGEVEHLWLDNSMHVATLDYDKAEIEAATIAFARRVTA